ncbi:hypothetical protein GWI33_009784 [Rhynchophorus ferrugineus]|uniref:Uncharacterized protein n=1 Tax=Rhynchophorus ferrugineus TaxID=354439 RepID=A0A834IXN3_RHYFE|nr:hypothetical protein GWI33_009784 [Rhynchophorus ferrugineus]
MIYSRRYWPVVNRKDTTLASLSYRTMSERALSPGDIPWLSYYYTRHTSAILSRTGSFITHGVGAKSGDVLDTDTGSKSDGLRFCSCDDKFRGSNGEALMVPRKKYGFL